MPVLVAATNSSVVVIEKLTKWVLRELGYAPKEITSSTRLPNRYRLLVNSVEGNT